LYLHEELETASAFHRMAGIIPAQALHRHRKGHFGYVEVTLEKDCLLGQKGDSFRAHEFHYWESTMKDADCFVVKPGNGNTWREGFCTKTLYAGFPHLYFYGSPRVGEHFLQAAREYSRREGGTTSEDDRHDTSRVM
jgi:cobyrinic acid a,c-diamide synthase